MTDLSIDPNGPLGYLVDKPKPTGPDNTMGKDTFLKLLVAQMKYQNPMDPSDSTEFIAQTAQFTLVEQMEKLSKANEAMLQSQLSTTAAAMVGKHVQWTASEADETDAPSEGDVQGVRITADGPILLVDGWEVALNRITAFGVAPTTTPDTTGTPTTSETDGATTTDGTDAVDAVDDTTTTDETVDTVEDTTATDDTTTTTTPVTDDTTTDPADSGTDPATGTTTDPETATTAA